MAQPPGLSRKPFMDLVCAETCRKTARGLEWGVRRFALGILVVLLLALPASSLARRRARDWSVHCQITAVAPVETAPLRSQHNNGREFEELDVTILSLAAIPKLLIDTENPVHLVHDL